MKQIIYKKDGILIGDNFVSLSEIIKKCNKEKLKEEKLFLLKMESNFLMDIKIFIFI